MKPPPAPGFLSPESLRGNPEGVLTARMAGQGSGTGLQPESSPMRMWSQAVGPWQLRYHGNGVLAWNGATGPRGYGELSFQNWAMAMGSRVWGPGILDLRFMGSLDPATTPPGGTPQLFQTGETFGGRPLVDRQHPHDLFMELAGRYTVPLATGSAIFVYGGPVGEPALGPGAYPHRISASDNGIAPLSHHLQDSTHIAFGVLTAGLEWNRWQLETSAFNGREPDENRWTIDLGPLDSYSGRLSLAPSRNWTLQVSSGFLKQPEPLEPGDIVRTTASVGHNWPLQDGSWASTIAWGQNLELSKSRPANSLLVESSLDVAERWHVSGRFEVVDKKGIPAGTPGQGEDETLRRISALTLGGGYDLLTNPVEVGIGGDVTLHSKPTELDSTYGAAPVSFRVFIRMRPPRMKH